MIIMYGINSRVYDNLIKYFKENHRIISVKLVGSRATGKEKVNSDIDLCIECIDCSKGTIVNDIDEIVGIYSCDVVFEDALNEEIRNQICRDGVVIYKR